jgi:hypothetical protein
MLIAQSTIKPLHSYFPHTCWVWQVLTLAINNVDQKEEATLKSCEDVAGSRRTQPPVECLWSLVSSFLGLSVNSDNFPFSYVILFQLFTYVNYMHENWSWHPYRFALGFLWEKQVWQRCTPQNDKETKGVGMHQPGSSQHSSAHEQSSQSWYKAGRSQTSPPNQAHVSRGLEHRGPPQE